MRPDAQRWLRRRSYDAADADAAVLAASKRGARVSVILPALNEAATIGPIVTSLATRLGMRHGAGLVDEIVVMDPGSTDGTAAIAAAAGARVVACRDVLPGHGDIPGKGDALWKGLAATDGDLVVFVDADLEQFDPQLVTGLLFPLITDPAVSFVKAAYERPLRTGGGGAGGRVTELVARPVLNAHWPALAGIRQPLAGECAARRTLLEQLPFVSGYGVELGLLLDAAHLAGLDALAQVDVGTKLHRHHGDEALGRMAAAIWQTALDRLSRQGLLSLPVAASPTLTQFVAGEPVEYTVSVSERPPLAATAGYVSPASRRAS